MTKKGRNHAWWRLTLFALTFQGFQPGTQWLYLLRKLILPYRDCYLTWKRIELPGISTWHSKNSELQEYSSPLWTTNLKLFDHFQEFQPGLKGRGIALMTTLLAKPHGKIKNSKVTLPIPDGRTPNFNQFPGFLTWILTIRVQIQSYSPACYKTRAVGWNERIEACTQ